jgi:hypothetical protein
MAAELDHVLNTATLVEEAAIWQIVPLMSIVWLRLPVPTATELDHILNTATLAEEAAIRQIAPLMSIPEDPPFGDFLAVKNEHHVRIIFQNVNGIRHSQNANEDLNYIMDTTKYYRADIASRPRRNQPGFPRFYASTNISKSNPTSFQWTCRLSTI